MATFTFFAYTASDLGALGLPPGGQFSAGGSVRTLSVTDDDPVLDDEASSGGETRDSTEQTLAADFAPSQSAGQVIQSVYKYDVENTTTNETGTMYVLRVYQGTDTVAPGPQAGSYIYASDIEFSPGDTLSVSNGNFVGQVEYASLAGPPAPCFARGSLIETINGPVAVEAL